MDIVNLAYELKESIGSWLDQMNQGLEPGRFRFCKRGSLVPVSGRQGQFVTCFAIKTAWHIGRWKSWSDFQRQACIRFIQSFQQSTGYFVDEGILSKIRWGSLIPSLRAGQWQQWPKQVILRALRAETRQSASTLAMAQAQLPYPLPAPYSTPEQIRDYLQELPWAHPWQAGSHASHLLFFFHFQDPRGRSQELIATIYEELDRLRDPETGTWFRGHVSDSLKINGAMKILSGYQWSDRPLSHAKELLDFSLSQPFEQHGCGFLNRLFVIYSAHRHIPGYREDHIKENALQALHGIMRYRQSDGVFSFYKDQAQKRYYDAWVSLGGKQGDLHGATLFTWACALCFDLLGIADLSGWQPSKP